MWSLKKKSIFKVPFWGAQNRSNLKSFWCSVGFQPSENDISWSCENRKRKYALGICLYHNESLAFSGGRYALVITLYAVGLSINAVVLKIALVDFTVGQIVVAVPRPNLLSQCPCPDPSDNIITFYHDKPKLSFWKVVFHVSWVANILLCKIGRSSPFILTPLSPAMSPCLTDSSSIFLPLCSGALFTWTSHWHCPFPRK